METLTRKSRRRENGDVAIAKPLLKVAPKVVEEEELSGVLDFTPRT